MEGHSSPWERQTDQDRSSGLVDNLQHVHDKRLISQVWDHFFPQAKPASPQKIHERGASRLATHAQRNAKRAWGDEPSAIGRCSLIKQRLHYIDIARDPHTSDVQQKLEHDCSWAGFDLFCKELRPRQSWYEPLGQPLRQWCLRGLPWWS